MVLVNIDQYPIVHLMSSIELCLKNLAHPNTQSTYLHLLKANNMEWRHSWMNTRAPFNGLFLLKELLILHFQVFYWKVSLRRRFLSLQHITSAFRKQSFSFSSQCNLQKSCVVQIVFCFERSKESPQSCNDSSSSNASKGIILDRKAT